jgi:hypothetical protein
VEQRIRGLDRDVEKRRGMNERRRKSGLLGQSTNEETCDMKLDRRDGIAMRAIFSWTVHPEDKSCDPG